jgi:hypothetical protein
MTHRGQGMALSRAGLVLALIVSTAGGAAQASHKGRIAPTPDRDAELRKSAKKFARAIVANRRWIRRAAFATLPPGGNPAAVSNERLAGFPLRGRNFGILSNGDATFADDPNDEPDKGAAVNGPFLRGVRDVTIFKLKLVVPEKANCLSVRFRFLSEEFPEFVNDQFNDGFIVELDSSTWRSPTNENPQFSAPDNFAFDTKRNPIAVNSVGDTTVFKRASKGTTYDAATRRLRASTPVGGGRTHVLYLSIFDQGDRIFDSAAFVDNVTLDRRKPCEPGAVRD